MGPGTAVARFRARRERGLSRRALAIGLWAVLQFVSGFTVTEETGGGVAYMAHIGGFVAGVVAGLLFRTLFHEPRRPRGAPASAYG